VSVECRVSINPPLIEGNKITADNSSRKLADFRNPGLLI
jgi:hypothetical protein